MNLKAQDCVWPLEILLNEFRMDSDRTLHIVDHVIVICWFFLSLFSAVQRRLIETLNDLAKI